MTRTTQDTGRFPPSIPCARWAPLVRHCALLGAVLVALIDRHQITGDLWFLWIIAGLGIVNLQGALLPAGSPVRRWGRRVSPFLSLGGWVTLVHLSGGVRSPFVIGVWLELVLSGVAAGAVGVWFLTATAAGGLALQQFLPGLTPQWPTLLLQCLFLAVNGLVLWSVHQGQARAGRESEARQVELLDRLRTLETEVAGLRQVESVGERAARVTHGLVNSVHSLKGFTALLLEDAADLEKVAPLLSGIQRVTGSLEELVRLTLNGPPQPDDPPPAAEVPLPRLLDDVVEELHGAYPGIQVARELPESLPTVAVPGAQVRELLVVQLRNAAEAMNGRGRIVVRASLTDHELSLTVADTGGGIPRDILAQLFRRPSSSKGQGRGLGLYLLWRRLEALGGRLSVDSTGPSGTVFRTRLPLAQGTAP